MDGDDVDDYVTRCRQLIEASPQMDEENTKVRLVQPFLELLGWDFLSTEVELEYTVPMASGSTRVDYALLVGGSPAVFVEAKPVRSALTESDAQQLKSYMRQELDVDWGILTNGKEFEVLTKNRERSGGEEVSVIQFDLDDLTENPTVLELLSKESIRSGQADEIAEQVARTNRAIRRLQENEDAVTEAVTDSVGGEVGDLPIGLEEQAREFVQNLVSVLSEQRQFASDGPPLESDRSTNEIVDADETETPAEESVAANGTGELAPLENHVSGTVSREELEGDDSATVAVFPTRESGLPFLKENEAWGFVRVGSEFEYVAMYVTGDVREVKYLARVDAILEPDDADLLRDPLDYRDGAKIADGKKVIAFEPGSLSELEDPIPYDSKYPQGLRYTTLGAIRDAETTDDVF
ncbi:type I restriction enzyme HsdR N-terminal domain-containing protein [Natronococcus sp. A-GB1]|uniref:type I restriction enzyme HsdR N-terminal domain-containing protein n=1 Tax=Natronococcus sp. A-GB1 TaxID=3037648 RepID=UPI00241DBD3B|nr:type I restriction endonuclease [Natronococcus sp. A-GB1]MDG5759705.1 type I restriction enzyme HsdR N-terminal domain-containing protein [Natronococcus sp. A-GB1]